MNIKKIQATDMYQAVSEISRQYGPDAVMLSSRKVKKKGIRNFFSKPYYEIVVSYDPEKTPLALKMRAAKGLTQGRTNPEETAKGASGQNAEKSFGALSGQLDSIQTYLQKFDDRLKFARNIRSDYRPEVEKLLVRLLDNQVNEELAQSIAREADGILEKQKDIPAGMVFERLIMDCMGQPHTISQKKFEQKVVLFLGTTGVGKTTSLVKLATHFSMNEKKKVGIINTDTYRIAAHEQLKIYADILDIPLGIVYNPEEITKVLEEQADRDIIFIDTPGKTPRDPQHKESVQKLVELSGAEEILLTISVPTSFAASKEIIDSYRFLDHYSLLFTKLDETGLCGNLLNARWYAGKELTYLTTGQNVPGDIEPADKKKLAERILSAGSVSA